MFFGKNPFIYENNSLNLQFKPVIPKWLFKKNKTVTVNFLSKIPITIYNPKLKNTWEIKIGDKIIKGFDGTLRNTIGHLQEMVKSVLEDENRKTREKLDEVKNSTDNVAESTKSIDRKF